MKRLSLILLMAGFASCCWAQEKKSEKRYRFSVTGGLGWTHYINTLKIGTNLAVEDHLGFSFKILWEPEHRLALGLESGYYTFYEVERTSPVNAQVTGRATLNIVPIMLHIRFRIIDNFYLSTGTGAAMLLSRIEGIGGAIDSNQVSLSNFQLSASYLRPISPRLRLGVELKYLSVDKTEDLTLSLMAVASFRF